MTDQEKVKERIQQEILDKLTSKLLGELKIKDYQIRVIKCDLIKARIEKKIEENNIYIANARYDSTEAKKAMYANKQLNEIYNMVSTIMLE